MYYQSAGVNNHDEYRKNPTTREDLDPANLVLNPAMVSGTEEEPSHKPSHEPSWISPAITDNHTNGKAERRIRELQEIDRAMLIHANK